MNGNSLRIYTIQYRIKKNKVDRHRKSTEARRLKESFDLQIQDYLYALYTSSVHIWSHINISNCNLRMNKINIKSKPNKVIEKNLSNDQNQYSFSQLVSTLKNDKSLSLNVWSDLLGQFNYLWSNESILSFCNFLSSQACDCIECFSQCFLIEPNVQKYFYLSLKEPLSYLFKSKNMIININKSLLLHASIMPSFLKHIIMSATRKSMIFYHSLLKNVLKNPVLFDLATPEMHIHYQNVLDSIIVQYDKFFSSSEGESLIQNIINEPTSLCLFPSETLIMEVSPHFKSLTIENNGSSLIYVSSSIINPSKTNSEMNLLSNNLSSIIRRILLKSDLILFDSEYNDLMEYLQQLIDLSSSNNSYLDSELDKLYEFLGPNKMSLQQICDILDKELDIEEESHSKDPIVDISKYSRQFTYIDKLIKNVNQIENRSREKIIYFELIDFSHEFFKKNPIPENIDESLTFADYFKNAVSMFPNHIQENETSRRILHSIFIHEFLIIEEIKNNNGIIEEDNKTHNFIDKNKQFLINDSNQKFLDIYKRDPSLLKYYFDEINLAFDSEIPIVRFWHIHNGFEMLNSLLQHQNIGEVGADQIIPLSVMAIVMANPFGIASTAFYLSNYIEPLGNEKSILEHSEEYSQIQFLSMFQFLKERMTESKMDDDF